MVRCDYRCYLSSGYLLLPQAIQPFPPADKDFAVGVEVALVPDRAGLGLAAVRHLKVGIYPA